MSVVHSTYLLIRKNWPEILVVWSCKRIFCANKKGSVNTCPKKVDSHNIIQIHNNVMRDSQCSMEYSSHSDWMWGIFCRLLSVPQYIVMDLNNVMLLSWITQFLSLATCQSKTWNGIITLIGWGRNYCLKLQSFSSTASGKLNYTPISGLLHTQGWRPVTIAI